MIRIANIFDPYELKARITPAIIILTPMLLVLFVHMGSEGIGLLDGVVSSAVGLVVVYLLGQFFAFMGRKLQATLFQKWGGAPSTKILRWRDGALSDEQKKNIRNAVNTVFGIAMPKQEDETTDPQVADERIDDIFKEVRSYLYEKESKGLWRNHLAEYGLVRNLLGSAWIGAAIAAISGIVCFYKWYRSSTHLAVWISVVCVIWTVAFIVGRYTFLISFTEHLGTRYAESAWLGFLSSRRASSEGEK